MTSCAPRLKKDNGPTWTSVSIHWTDSDASSFVPVDGLPWIRKTDKSKLFNKNGPLRVVGKYRNTLGVDSGKESDYRHISLIADAIEQYLLIEVVMTKEVAASPGGDWPKFRVWAFLQPPTIGNNAERNKANGGYVVDDLPRAGWFEAVVDGKSMTAEEIDYSKGHKSPVGKKKLDVTGERDATKTNVVRFKLCARVANNESEEELKEKSKKLRQKHQDISLMEAGSYLKVWVRNEERTWSVNPLDDDSEKIVDSMANADVIKPARSGDPRKFRNHTWKRSRLATHKSIAGKGKNPDEALLYVGLYPAHVIEKMEKIESEAKEAHGGKVELQKAREFSFPNWFAVTVAYGMLSYAIRKWRDKKASSTNKHGVQHGIVDATKYVSGFVEALSLPDLFAAFAVAGFSDFPKLAETFKAAESLPNASDITKKLYVRLLQAFLELDKENQEEGAKAKKEAAEAKGLSKFKPEKFWNWGALWKEQSANISLQLIEGKDKTFGPWPKLPKPLPGYLAWLGFQTKLVASGNLPIGLYADGAELGSKEGSKFVFKIATQGKEKAGVQATYSIMIRALWSYLADAKMSDTMKEKGKTPVLDTLKELLEVIDVELTLAPSINNEIVLGWGGEWTKEGGTAKWMNDFMSKLNTTFHAQASIFQWNYDTLNGALYEGDSEYGTFFKDVEAFGNKIPQLQWSWGDSPFDKHCSLASTLDSDGEAGIHKSFCLGEPFQLFLGYKPAAPHPEKCKVILRFASVADNVNALSKETAARGSMLELASDLEVENDTPKPGSHKGEVVCASRLTWSDTKSEGEKGVVSFRSLVKTKRAAMKQLFQTCVNESEFQFSPGVKLPESKRERSLGAKSELRFLSPKLVDESGVLRTGNPPDLVWIFHIEHYADTHVWIQLKEHNLIYSDGLMPLLGGQNGGWKLVEWKGHTTGTQRLITLPLREIGTPPDTESTYEVYLRLGLLDDDSCCFHTSKVRIKIPGQLLTGKH